MTIIEKIDKTSQPPLGELFERLVGDMRLLVTQEMRLARQEMTGKAKAAAGDVALLSSGLFLVHCGVLLLLAGGVSALLAVGVPAWAACGVIGLVILTLGGVLTLAARHGLGRRL